MRNQLTFVLADGFDFTILGPPAVPSYWGHTPGPIKGTKRKAIRERKRWKRSTPSKVGTDVRCRSYRPYWRAMEVALRLDPITHEPPDDTMDPSRAVNLPALADVLRPLAKAVIATTPGDAYRFARITNMNRMESLVGCFVTGEPLPQDVVDWLTFWRAGTGPTSVAIDNFAKACGV